MKIQVQSKKGLRTVLSVVIDKTIQLKMDERLSELQKVALKGFNPVKFLTQ